MKSIIRRSFSLVAFLSTLLAMLSVSAPVKAASSGAYSMEVLVDGSPLREYYSRGRTYIEARKSHEYAIRLSNRTGERVAVALAVDGMNTIDAKHTSAKAARKWVLGPYESIVIEGWQTSSATARQFYFTGEASSYGAWMGQTRDLGNISAAFFQEVRPRYMPPEDDYWGGDFEELAGARGAAPMEKSRRSSADAAPAASAEGRSGAGIMREPMPQKKDELAATGIGRERDHQVYTVEFREQASPSAVITLRYEFRPKLIELGVIPRPPYRQPMDRRETSSGFSDYGYAPDPYRGR